MCWHKLPGYRLRIPALVSGTLPENCTDPSRRQRTEAQHRLQRASAKLSSKRKGNSPEGRLTVVHLRRFAPLVKMANRKRCLWTPEKEPAAATPGAGGRGFRPNRQPSQHTVSFFGKGFEDPLLVLPRSHLMCQPDPVGPAATPD